MAYISYRGDKKILLCANSFITVKSGKWILSQLIIRVSDLRLRCSFIRLTKMLAKTLTA